jgi:hypothetical protein
LFDGENILFDASLVIYVNSTNIPPIMIINRIYENQSSYAVACFLPGRAKDLSAPLYFRRIPSNTGRSTFDLHRTYRGADKSLARPTSRCILFDGENISFDTSLVIYIYIYINSTNIPPIMIINRIYEHQYLLSL